MKYIDVSQLLKGQWHVPGPPKSTSMELVVNSVALTVKKTQVTNSTTDKRVL